LKLKMFFYLILLNIMFLFSSIIYNFFMIYLMGKPWVWGIEEIGHVGMIVLANLVAFSIVRRGFS